MTAGEAQKPRPIEFGFSLIRFKGPETSLEREKHPFWEEHLKN